MVAILPPCLTVPGLYRLPMFDCLILDRTTTTQCGEPRNSGYGKSWLLCRYDADMAETQKRKKDEPISLVPLDFKEALTDLLAVEPEEGEPEEVDEAQDESD